MEVVSKKNIIQQSTGICITVSTAASTLADKTFSLSTDQHQLSLKNYSKFLVCAFCENVIL
jgi:hypothetical protein